jgi:hypothetical protein
MLTYEQLSSQQKIYEKFQKERPVSFATWRGNVSCRNRSIPEQSPDPTNTTVLVTAHLQYATHVACLNAHLS